MISGILVLVGLTGLVGGAGVVYLAMHNKLAAAELSFNSRLHAAIQLLEDSGSKIEAEAKSDVAYVVKYLKSKL